MKDRLTLSFDWRRSAAHTLLLPTFWKLRPARELAPLPFGLDWASLLGEPPAEAINRFLAQGLLYRAGLLEKLDSQLSISRLRELARDRQLPASLRRKEELIAGLIQVDAEGMLDLSPPGEMLQCTGYGRHVVASSVADLDTISRLLDPEFTAVTATIFTWLLKEVPLPEAIRGGIEEMLAYVEEPAASAYRRPESEEEGLLSSTVIPSLELRWCYVPAGKFRMGSLEHDREAGDEEKPQHYVYAPAFYMSQVPITNQQYATFVERTGHRPPAHWPRSSPPENGPDLPVVNVSWFDALAFCHWAAQMSGIPIRLPTEAEWEKAARGERGFRYTWGNSWRAGLSNIENEGGGIFPVGSFPQGASPYQVYDMAGNVWEWTGSLYRPYPYRADDGRERLTISGARVIRGGAYYTDRLWARTAFRSCHPDDEADDALGFRVACSAPYSLLSSR